MITSAMRLNETDLTIEGNIKAHYVGATVCAVVENKKVAIVKGYSHMISKKPKISDCERTNINVADLAGLARACYGHMQDAPI